MPPNLAFVTLGAAIVGYTGIKLVDLAAALADEARLTPAVIGLTVVAAGTPELVVSLTAALQGCPGKSKPMNRPRGDLLPGPTAAGARPAGHPAP